MTCRSEQYSGSTTNGRSWANWATLAGGNVETFYEPASLPDIVHIVQDAQTARKRVRAVGSGWAFEDIAYSPEVMISLERLNSVLTCSHPFTPEWALGAMTSSARGFAFDYSNAGKLDHLVFYRPGETYFWILQNNGGTFSHVPGYNGSGIRGYDFADPRDRAFAFDYNGNGRQDNIVVYRPGTGRIWILNSLN